ncbi:MAG: isoprenylcysteine carboxylmethyltransferase family protein [Anaerolineales bacterium]
MLSQSLVEFAAIVAAVLAYGALHSFLASHTAKRWSRQQFGRNHDRYYRLAFNVIGGLTFLPVMALVALLPSPTLYSVTPPWLWLTLAVQLLAIVLLLAGLSQTGAASFLGFSQLANPDDNDGDFTASGPYRWIRHPLYTAGLLFIWAVPLMTAGILALNLGLTIYLYVGSVFEERKLSDELGPVYQRYRQQVPRFIPLPGRQFDGGRLNKDGQR